MGNAQRPIGRVILTHGRTLHTLAAAHSLARRGVEVIGCDETPLMMLSFSRHVSKTFLHPTMEDGPEAYLEVMEEKVREFQPEGDLPYVLMPTDRRTPLIAKHRERFEPMIRVATPAYDAIQQVYTKDRLAKTCHRLGVPMAPTWLAADEAEVRQQLEEISFPAFLKVPDGSGGVGLEKVSNADELLAAFREFQDEFGLGPRRVGVIQAAVEGDDYCLGALFCRGQLAAHMAYKNLATYPAKGGFGVLRETVPSDKLAEIAQQLLGPLNWHGVAELDYRWDGKDSTEPKLIEVNTRFWGGLFQSVESGIDFPWLLYQLTVFDRIDPPPPAKIGLRTQIPIVSLLSQLQESLDDESSLERMKTSLTVGWQRILSGNVWRGLKKIAAGIGDALDPSERLKRVQHWFEETQNAKSELLSTDDPLAALGMLYVVGSLIRNGKLPEEFARSGEGEAIHEPENTESEEAHHAAASPGPLSKKR